MAKENDIRYQANCSVCSNKIGFLGNGYVHVLSDGTLCKNCNLTLHQLADDRKWWVDRDEFNALGCETYVCTADGSYGIRGFVTTAMESLDYSYFYTCGPLPMFKAINRVAKTSGQLSFEERMGCGFGACMGCSCKTITGYKRICKDGPVLEREEILWEQI